ncbi:MAG: hypothetical protein AAGH83_07215 [Pseudomonadota bacterium]
MLNDDAVLGVYGFGFVGAVVHPATGAPIEAVGLSNANLVVDGAATRSEAFASFLVKARIRSSLAGDVSPKPIKLSERDAKVHIPVIAARLAMFGPSLLVATAAVHRGAMRLTFLEHSRLFDGLLTRFAVSTATSTSRAHHTQPKTAMRANKI